MKSRKHGHAFNGLKTPTYRSWYAMVARCTNPKNKRWARYGGRGIKVCDRWLDFRNFLADMGERPVGMTLDRSDNARGYEPANCRWATAIEQGRNTARTRLIAYEGKSYPLRTLAEHFGINHEALRHRLDAGWPVEKALKEPLLLANSHPMRSAA